jgi:Ca2+-binding RTX toxin-like protein
MLTVRLHDAAGATPEDFFHPTGEAIEVQTGARRIVSVAPIIDGPFAGELQRQALIGRFDPDTGKGMLAEIRARVAGELHYVLSFDDPIPLRGGEAELDAALATGVHFRGNAAANVLAGGVGRDVLAGAGGGDTLRGAGGEDRLRGGPGHDTLHGGRGGDRLQGGTGKDWIEGSGGQDLIEGGKGNDVLLGGGGSDVFRFGSARETGSAAGSADLILDFKSGRDTVDVSGIDARSGTRRDDEFDFIGDDRFTDEAGQLRFRNGKVMGDTDGDGAADFKIDFGEARLSGADLLL